MSNDVLRVAGRQHQIQEQVFLLRPLASNNTWETLRMISAVSTRGTVPCTHEESDLLMGKSTPHLYALFRRHG